MIENELQRIVGALEKANVLQERTLEALIRMSVAIQNAAGKEVKVGEVKEIAAETKVPDAPAPEVPHQLKRIRRTKAQIAFDEAKKLAEEVEKAKAEPDPEPVAPPPAAEPAKPEPAVVEAREVSPPADDDFLAEDPPAPAAKKASTAEARAALMALATRKGGDAAARDAARALIKTTTGYANMTEVDAAAGGAAEHELYGMLVAAANAA